MAEQYMSQTTSSAGGTSGNAGTDGWQYGQTFEQKSQALSKAKASGSSNVHIRDVENGKFVKSVTYPNGYVDQSYETGN